MKTDDRLNNKIKVEQTVQYLQETTSFKPNLILQLGTGLGEITKEITQQQVIPYDAIPHFPKVAVDSHTGNLILGVLGGKKVAALQGRVHYYEGYSTEEVTFPIRVLSLLGCKYLVITNASGGLNSSFTAGSLMLISDHINFIGENPLRGPNTDEWGPRFPDMSEVYSKRLIHIAEKTARRLSITLEKGVYVALPGPSLETPAETRYLIHCGADAVGMSTVPEVIIAKHAGLEILGISVIANTNNPDNFHPILLEDVLKQMQETAPIVKNLILEIIKEFGWGLPKKL